MAPTPAQNESAAAGPSAMEARLQRLEDMIAIYQLISAYGPAVDSDSCKEAAELWTEGGRYEIAGIGDYRGRSEIQKLLESHLHQDLIMGGAAHVLSMPHVVIDGDTAIATNYAQVFVPNKESGKSGFRIYRVVASRWELVRTSAGWKCEYRVNQLLDGRSEARALLGEGVAKGGRTSG